MVNYASSRASGIYGLILSYARGEGVVLCTGFFMLMLGEGHLRPRRPPREYLGEYTSRGKPTIPPVDRILMDPDPGHKASKKPLR